MIADNLRESFTCGDTGSNIVGQQVCVGFNTFNATGDFSYLYDFSRQQALGGPFTFNGMTFPDVRMESYTGTSSQFRMRAKGIGEIYRRSRGTSVSTNVIFYYRVNGATGGSLVGTPFEPGVGPLDGLFF